MDKKLSPVKVQEKVMEEPTTAVTFLSASLKKKRKQNKLHLDFWATQNYYSYPTPPHSPENIIVKTAILVENTEKLESARYGLSSIMDLRWLCPINVFQTITVTGNVGYRPSYQMRSSVLLYKLLYSIFTIKVMFECLRNDCSAKCEMAYQHHWNWQLQ